ncbi:hypothetical protein TRL7639_00049 [Falsiruegeria litorea R37]|uniref:AAA+ ATPase domain-containing protein n=1 Tax=Falsiruegeria litorea R37 TaxID=1200284 RepID=A0A1Y5R7N7_9RHOB|nr:TniB family NTP-binding protein [Falsiruegeria litorea]SLN11032.1 hypothetical protein TRL7639_00049 [Falsiruegeria litorea R37]
MSHQALKAVLEQTIHHTLYQKARNELIETIALAQKLGGSIVPFLGPTRCGKSRMLEDIRGELGRPTKELEGWVYDSDFAIGSIPNKPNDKMLVRSMLASLGLNGKRGLSASEIEAQLYREITSKGIQVIALDECNHCAERGHHLSKRGVTDHFKRLVDNTGVTLVLCGLPKFQKILDEIEQCRDRSMKTIQILPYSWSLEEEKTNFAGAIATAFGHLQDLGVSFDFDSQEVVVRLYGVSGGRIGVVMRVLHGAVGFINNNVLTYESIARSAKTVLQAQHRPDFFADLGYRYGRPLIENISDLERACRLTQGELAAIAPEAKTDVASLDWQYDRRWSDPVCPECLANGHLYHQSWRHGLVTACHTLIELVSRIRRKATDAGGDTVAFSDLTLRRTTDKIALKKLLELICEGTVQATLASLDAKLADFRFLKSDVEYVLKSERHSLDWTANDVAKLTGWKAQSVTHWCKEGLLESRTVSHGIGVSFLVSPMQLAAFQSEFVPLGTIAKSRNTTSRKLLSGLAKRGIKTHGAVIEGKTSRGHLVKLRDLATLAD